MLSRTCDGCPVSSTRETRPPGDDGSLIRRTLSRGPPELPTLLPRRGISGDGGEKRKLPRIHETSNEDKLNRGGKRNQKRKSQNDDGRNHPQKAVRAKK